MCHPDCFGDRLTAAHRCSASRAEAVLVGLIPAAAEVAETLHVLGTRIARVPPRVAALACGPCKSFHVMTIAMALDSRGAKVDGMRMSLLSTNTKTPACYFVGPPAPTHDTGTRCFTNYYPVREIIGRTTARSDVDHAEIGQDGANMPKLLRRRAVLKPMTFVGPTLEAVDDAHVA